MTYVGGTEKDGAKDSDLISGFSENQKLSSVEILHREIEMSQVERDLLVKQ